MSPASTSDEVAFWLNQLPGWQQQDLRSLIQSHGGSELAAADAWFAMSGPTNTAPFGGAPGSMRTMLLDNLVLQMHILICTDEGYESLRKQLQSGVKDVAFTGIVTTALAPNFGVGAAVLGPGLSLLLAAAVKVGQGTVCAGLDSIIATRGLAVAPGPAEHEDPPAG